MRLAVAFLVFLNFLLRGAGLWGDLAFAILVTTAVFWIARRLASPWLAEGPLILGGDLNVAPTDSDIFHPDAFAGLTHVTEPERSALAAVLAEGLVDLDAQRWGPRERRFTWWSHGRYATNLGMRIDLLTADRALAQRLVTTWIDHIERGGERPSDHAALVADFDLSPRDA